MTRMIFVTWSYETFSHKVGMTRETSGRNEWDLMQGKRFVTVDGKDDGETSD